MALSVTDLNQQASKNACGHRTVVSDNLSSGLPVMTLSLTVPQFSLSQYPSSQYLSSAGSI